MSKKNCELVIEDESIRRYLLGALSAEDESALEEALFFDDDEGLLAVEAVCTELVRDYLAGDLSPDERQLFESKCITSSFWKGQFYVSKLLLTALAADNRWLDFKLAGDLVRAKGEDELAVERAITEILLPSLPVRLQTPGVPPKTCFLAIESISMLLHRRLRRMKCSSKIVFWGEDECFRSEHATLITTEVARREIVAVAKVPEDVASSLLRWIRQAARLNAYLMLGVESIPLEGGESVRLIGQERKLDEDLRNRWREGARRVCVEHEDYVLSTR